jgi:hypothetical protein
MSFQIGNGGVVAGKSRLTGKARRRKGPKLSPVLWLQMKP